MTDEKATYEFKAETKKLLDIVINSLYTERDVFVRELISNAADALEKFRHASITETEVFDDHLPLEITIELDEKNNTVTITDTGIGMNKSELENNLGTIAHSGSNTYLAGLVEAAKKRCQSHRPVRRRLLFGFYGRQDGQGADQVLGQE
jgi:molecular chaperone HtpG